MVGLFLHAITVLLGVVGAISANVPAVHELPQAVGRRCERTEPCTVVLWAGAVLGIRSQFRGAPTGFGFRVSRLGEWVGAARGSRRFRTCV